MTAAAPSVEAAAPAVPARRPRRRRGPGLLLQSLQLASIAYLASVGGLLWWSHAPMLVGWQPKVVLTGSMLPVIRPGDVALVGPGDAHGEGLPPGRIVLVTDPGRESGTYLHRVVRYEKNGFLVTKGDANPTEDHPAVDPDRVRGQVRLLVPAIGRPVVWLHDHRYLMLGGSLGLTWLAMAFALALRGGSDDDEAEAAEGPARRRRRAAATEGAPEGAAGAVPVGGPSVPSVPAQKVSGPTLPAPVALEPPVVEPPVFEPPVVEPPVVEPPAAGRAIAPRSEVPAQPAPEPSPAPPPAAPPVVPPRPPIATAPTTVLPGVPSPFVPVPEPTVPEPTLPQPTDSGRTTADRATVAPATDGAPAGHAPAEASPEGVVADVVPAVPPTTAAPALPARRPGRHALPDPEPVAPAARSVVMPDVTGSDAALPTLDPTLDLLRDLVLPDGIDDEPPFSPVGPPAPVEPTAAPGTGSATEPAEPAGTPLPPEAEHLLLDLDAFEAAFGSAFGAADDEDISDFDGRGFDR